MEAAEPSPIWCSQVCLGRPGGLLQPDGGAASIGTLEGISIAGTPLSSRATCPRRPRDGMRWRIILSYGDFLVGDMVIMEDESAGSGNIKWRLL